MNMLQACFYEISEEILVFGDLIKLNQWDFNDLYNYTNYFLLRIQ